MERTHETQHFAVACLPSILLASLSLYAWMAALAPARAGGAESLSLRAQVTTANWDKGGTVSHWVYTHISEVFPTAIVRRGGAVRELPLRPRAEIGALVVDDADRAGTLVRDLASEFVGVRICQRIDIADAAGR